MSGAAVVAAQNKLMRRFREAGATSPPSACTPEDVGCRNSWIFRRMTARRVFVEAKPGRYYIDEMASGDFIRMRRARMLWALAVVLALCGLMVLVTSQL
jgi:hypothetical protein